jgi:hypothetical protein
MAKVRGKLSLLAMGLWLIWEILWMEKIDQKVSCHSFEITWDVAE